MNIRAYYDGVDFKLQGWRKAVNIIKKVIRNENKVPGDLSFIFTDDKSLKEINQEFLQHDYFTDVIAFDSGLGNIVSGEIYISIDTVTLNAINYNVSLIDEVLRVMIHGVLHLCGYADKNIRQRKKMRSLEDSFLKMYYEEF